MRLTILRHRWYRLDREAPSRWRWDPFPAPAYRFDPASGRLRVRYAGQTPRTALRERFDSEGRVVSSVHLGLHLVELVGPARVLDLRLDRNLDALGLDDQVNTSRAAGVWVACHQLTDLVADWYGERCDGIAYRSRTSPQRSANLAFFAHARLHAHSLGRLGTQTELLAACVLADGFAVEGW